MVLNNYRHLLPRFIDKPVNFCIKHHITPNQISIIGFLVSAIAAVCYAFPDYFLYYFYKIGTSGVWIWGACVPPILFFLGGYIDVLDGSVARKSGQVSKFGAFLDSTLDRISDALIIIGLMYAEIIWPWNSQINYLLGFICMGTMLLISYTRSRAELEGVVMKGIGIMERAERVFILLGGYIIEWTVFAIEQYYYGTHNIRWVFPVFFLIFTILCIQTLSARISWASKWLNNKMPEKVAEILEKQNQQKLEAQKKSNSENSENSSKEE